MISKIVTTVTALVSIPLTLNYLGTERFGLWMTISSVVALLSFADFGIGNGLVSSIASASGKNDNSAIQNSIASGFVALGIIALAILFVFFSMYPSISWPSLFNVASALAVEEAGPALAVFAVCFALNIPLGIAHRVQSGLQQGYAANIWHCAGSILGLAAVLLAILFQAGLPWLVLAMSGAPLVSAVANSILFFGRHRPDLRPKFEMVSGASILRLAHIGALFFVLQLTAAVAFASDNIIIARMLGPDAVTEYAVPAKMFSFILVVISLLSAPLWPAYGEAITRGDISWVKETLAWTLKFTLLVSSILSLTLMLTGKHLLVLWVGPNVEPTHLLIVTLGLWTILEATGNTLAVFLNGANIIKVQVVLAICFAITCVLLKIYFVLSIGLAGIPIGAITAYLFMTILPLSILVPKWLNQRA